MNLCVCVRNRQRGFVERHLLRATNTFLVHKLFHKTSENTSGSASEEDLGRGKGGGGGGMFLSDRTRNKMY